DFISHELHPIYKEVGTRIDEWLNRNSGEFRAFRVFFRTVLGSFDLPIHITKQSCPTPLLRHLTPRFLTTMKFGVRWKCSNERCATQNELHEPVEHDTLRVDGRWQKGS